MMTRILIRNCSRFNTVCGPVLNAFTADTWKLQCHAVSSARVIMTQSFVPARPKQIAKTGEKRQLGSFTFAKDNTGFSNIPVWRNNRIRQYQEQNCCYSTEPHDSESASSPPTQLSQREKLKRAVKEYGSTVIVFHITISLASLGGFYLAVSSGIDMVGILKSVGVGEAILQSKLATGTGTFVVAYAVHKVFAPVRIGITLTATPFIVRYLRSKGILKPPKVKV